MKNLGKQSKPDVTVDELLSHFISVRALSERLCEPLAIEDYGLQAMAETSPARWHIAHTSWFFETFLLKPFLSGYKTINPKYEVIFNSYYNGVGPQHPRAQRSLLSRPTVEEVMQYRKQVTEGIADLLSTPELVNQEIISRVKLGCHHEQQHQELFFTDLKYCWFQNPLFPEYKAVNLNQKDSVSIENGSKQWDGLNPGIYEIGYQHNNSFMDFCFDNEEPVHRQFIEAVEISNNLVTNAEYLEFIEDNGYQRSEFWLSDAWMHLNKETTRLNPLYWIKQDGEWFEYSLSGLRKLDPALPVAHVSAYEANAYARWKGARLPTEFEWEIFSRQTKDTQVSQFLESGAFHPLAENSRINKGVLWQWTSSAYAPYPGYKSVSGAIGEYNGKFMCNQLVLRGGSCVTSENHYRHSYRNFFYPQDQWQFSGIRLAKQGMS